MREYTNIKQLSDDRKNIANGEVIRFRGEELVYTPSLVDHLLYTRDDGDLGIEEIVRGEK